jgi:hypothetical protein
MKTLFLLGLISFSALAQNNPSQDAIILNQEMQFLEESAKNVTAVSNPIEKEEKGQVLISDRPTRSDREMDLERSYFGDEEDKDTIRTRTAAPRRMKKMQR